MCGRVALGLTAKGMGMGMGTTAVSARPQPPQHQSHRSSGADLADPVGDRVCETMRVAREVGGSDLGTTRVGLPR